MRSIDAAIQFIKQTNPEAKEFFASNFCVSEIHETRDGESLFRFSWYGHDQVFSLNLTNMQRLYRAQCVVDVQQVEGGIFHVSPRKVRWMEPRDLVFVVQKVEVYQVTLLSK